MKQEPMSKAGHWGGREGFSLIEAVAALVLLGVLAVTVTIQMQNMPAAVAAEAASLRSHLRFAQGMAMANNTATWSVLITGSAYTLQRNGVAAPVNWPGENASSRALPAGVQFVGGGGVLTFNEWGAPAADFLVSLSDGAHTEQVQVLAFTGLIP